MEPRSVSGLVLQVTDVDRTIMFYKRLGFRIAPSKGVQRAYIKSFWLEFAQDTAALPVTSQYICISVADAQDFFEHCLKTGLHPKTQPMREKSGRLEFQLDDPDGHQLICYSM